MTELFNGVDTTALDADGRAIRCGDRVTLWQRKPEHRQTHTEDGYGRDRELPSDLQRTIPATEKTTQGTVVFDSHWLCFAVAFDDYLLDSGNKKMELYRLLGKSDCKLTRH